jgi:hypothetical protein
MTSLAQFITYFDILHHMPLIPAPPLPLGQAQDRLKHFPRGRLINRFARGGM